MLVFTETTSCSPAVTVKVEPHKRTDGWTSSTCCLCEKKTSRAAFFTGARRKRSSFSCSDGRSKTMPWGVSMFSSFINVLNSRTKQSGVSFWRFYSFAWRCICRWTLSLPLDSEEDDHGRIGEGGAPAAPSVPVPRPVARGLADGRQVGMLNRLRTAHWIHCATVRHESIIAPHLQSTYSLCSRIFSLCSFWSKCMNVLE